VLIVVVSHTYHRPALLNCDCREFGDDYKIKCPDSTQWFLARNVIYTFRAYATMSVSVCLSVRLFVTEVHWRIVAI